MAQITRQLWSALRDEAILASGGHAYTGFSGRIEYWMTQAYYDICATYHQYELDKDLVVAVTQGSNRIDLPTDCFIVVAVGVVDDSEQPVSFLRSEHFRLQGGGFRSTQAEFMSFSRFQNSLFFNAQAKANTKVRLYYYRFPNAPDFAGTSGQPNSVPETKWLWDAHIIDATVARAQRRIWRPDLGGLNTQALSEWLDEQVQAQAKKDPIGAQPDKSLSNLALGGKQT